MDFSNSRLALKAFEANLGSTFRLYPSQGDPIDLLLVAAKQIRRDTLQDIYSVSFRGPQERELEQGTYQLDHSRMGAFQIFIVPFKRDQGFVFYDATFNLLLRPLRID